MQLTAICYLRTFNHNRNVMKRILAIGLLVTVFSANAGNPKLDYTLKGDRTDKLFKFRNASFSKSGMGEEDRESHGPGLFANIGLFMPTSKFMDPYYEPGDDTYNTGFAAEVGNYFRLFHTERMGLGLRATWIQLKYTTFTVDDTTTWGNASGSPLRIGPQFSYAIDENMGFDVYYQLGAQYNIEWFPYDGKNENSSFLGVTHEIGFAYRFMFLTAGAGLKFGNGKNIDNSFSTELFDEKFPTGGFRIFVGIQL